MFSFARRPRVDPYAAILAACAARDPVELLKHANDVAADRKGYDAFWDWAVLGLDVWGLEQCLAHAFPGNRSLHRFFAALSAPLGPTEAEHAEHRRLKNEVWPALWTAALPRPAGLKRLLPAIYLAHHQERPLALPLVDLPNGPFSEAFHSHLLLWAPRREVWSGNFVPLQVAWASQNMPLVELLLKHGAGLEQSFEGSAWPQWTLQSAMANPHPGYGANLSTVPEYGVRQLLKKAEEQYPVGSKALNEIKQAVRVGLLERGLPNPSPVRAVPRF